jgi:hypothetical protein
VPLLICSGNCGLKVRESKTEAILARGPRTSNLRQILAYRVVPVGPADSD